MTVLQSGITKSLAADYTIDQSLRLNKPDSPYLTKTYGGAGDRRKWTWSGWIKRGLVSSSGPAMVLFSAQQSASHPARPHRLGFGATDGSNEKFELVFDSGATYFYGTTTPVFRDPGAWYHICVVWDTAQSVDTDRFKIYINNVNYSLTVDQGNWTSIPINTDGAICNAVEHRIGMMNGYSRHFDGYLAEVYLIDGQALTPSDFAEEDATTGQWIPKDATGLTFGTNGFFIDFRDSSDLGDDESGNGNDYTANNLSTWDQMKDSPTANLPTYNPLCKITSATNNGVLSEGSLTSAGGAGTHAWPGTFAAASGKWYWEVLWTASTTTGGRYMIVFDAGNQLEWNAGPDVGWTDGRYGVVYDGNVGDIYNNGTSNLSQTGLATLTDGDIISVALDLDASPATVQFYKNNATIGNAEDLNASASGIWGLATNSNTNWTWYLNTGSESSFAGNKSLFTYQTGNRTASITVTTNVSWTGNDSNLVDGNYDGGGDDWVSSPLFGDVASGPKYITFDYGVGNTVTNLSCLWWQNDSNDRANWKWQGSQNNSDWTDLTGTVDCTGGSWSNGAHGRYIEFTEMSGNTTAYRYYRIVGVSGTANDTGKIYEFEFANATAGGNADENGVGDFYYAPPSGYLALATSNLPAPSIKKSTDNFNISLYDGNGSTQSITGVGFQPDLLYGKVRNDTYDPIMSNSISGTGKYIFSLSTAAEVTNANGITSFDSDGFSIGSQEEWNPSLTVEDDMVVWSWLGAAANASNEDGDITSVVRANTTAGFSVVSWAGTSSQATVGHGLDSAPTVIWIKDLTGTNSWIATWPSVLTAANYSMELNNDYAESETGWSGVTSVPTSTIFNVANNSAVNATGRDYIAFCWHPVDGYSSMGRYDGNSNANGSFIYCGFRPAFVLVKRFDGVTDWNLSDTARNPANPAKELLFPNSNRVETSASSGSYAFFDIVSNGFKFRGTSGEGNVGDYVYLAFSKFPLKYANAR